MHGLIHHFGEHFANGVIAAWRTQRRREFRKRLENKPPLRYPWMRDFQSGRVDHGIAKEQDVEIDDSRSFGYCSLPAHLLLDLQQSREQLSRE